MSRAVRDGATDGVASTRAGLLDHATDLALAILEGDAARADRALENALAVIRDDFDSETTARDLGWLADAMRRRGEDADWVTDIVEELRAARRP